MELGNIYHPHGNFLSVAEGIDLLSNKMSVTLHNEKNCYITGESSLQHVFREYFNELHGIYFLMIVTSGMSFCVVKSGDFIFLFDSHSHGDMGAAIHSAKLDHMDNFIDEFPAPKNDLMYTCVVAVEWVWGTCYFCLRSKCFKVEGGWYIVFLLVISEVKVLWG